MIAIVDKSQHVIYRYAGEGQYPSCLAEKEGYTHVPIPDRGEVAWFRTKYDSITKLFMDSPLAEPSAPPPTPIPQVITTDKLLLARVDELESKLRALLKNL